MKYGNISNYIEVEPAIPTYFVYANFMVARIVKQLLSVNPNEPDKLIIQGSWSSCFMEDDDPDDCNLSFSTLPLHPDTMQDRAAASVLEELNDDKKEAEEELALWGITKVYMLEDTSKVLSIHDFYDSLPVPDEEGKSIGCNYIVGLETPERMKVFEQG